MMILNDVRTTSALSLILAAALVGCGGGGGDAGTPVPVISSVDMPVQSAMSAYAKASHTYNLSGNLTTAPGTVVTYTMDYGYIPETATTQFDGSTVSAAAQTVVVRQSGNTTPLLQQSFRSFFTTNPYAIYGSIDQDNSAFTVVTRSSSLPTAAHIGQSGTLGTETEYTDSTKTTVTGTSSLSWSMEADTADSALLCILAQFAGSTSSSTNCYRIDRSGNVTALIVRITNDQGATLTLK